VKTSQITKNDTINTNFYFYVYKVKLHTMKKLMIISFALLGVLHAQTGNHIHHLFGLKQSTAGLVALDALDQKTGNSVEVETFSLNFELGGAYAYRTINNKVYYLDAAAQFTVGVVANYNLPEIYSTDYQGGFGLTTFQAGISNICVNPEGDSLLYAFNINTGLLSKFGLNGGSFGVAQNLSGILDTAFVSMVYYNDQIYLAGGIGGDSSVMYVVDANNMQILNTEFYDSKFMYLVAHPQLGLFALGQNGVSQNFLAGILPTSLALINLGALPSCTNCATSSFLYDRNAMVIDSTNQQLIVSRSEQFSGLSTQYYLSTFDLLSASPVYEVQTLERYSNLIFQKPLADLVYPGDTDHDKDVDMQDLLAIGLFYNNQTNGRFEISNEWIGQAAVNSNITLTNGVDQKHADSNGDGQINAVDYNAISLNYSYTHYSEKSTNASCDFPLYVSFPSLVKEDQPISIQIGLDLSNLPSQNVYGVTFTIEYDSTFVVANTMNTQGVNAWFGTEDGNYIQQNIDDFPAGKMDVGVVGIDKLNRNGGGVLLDGIWTMEDVVIPIAQGYRDMPFKISNVFIIDYDENVIDACGVDTVIRVYDKNVGVFEREELALNIYPNPTKASFINLEHVADLEYVEIYDMQGRRVQTWHEKFSQLHIGDFNKGVYILKAYTADKVYLNKLVYNKE